MPKVRTPTNVLELRGSFDKNPQRRRPNEPKVTKALGAPARHLSTKAKAAWKEIGGLCPAGVLTQADRLAVEMAAVLLVEFREMGPDFPANRLVRLESLLARFGMTPADRSKVTAAGQDKDEDPWESV